MDVAIQAVIEIKTELTQITFVNAWRCEHSRVRAQCM
jgi:hypothetical protein